MVVRDTQGSADSERFASAVALAIGALLTFGHCLCLFHVLATARSGGIKLSRFVAEDLTITQRMRTSTLSSQNRSSANREEAERTRSGPKALWEETRVTA
jgi:hypothetical protein